MKYCLLCRGEYRDAVMVCATCQAALVPSLGSPEARANPSRLLWVGKDQKEFEVLAGALRDAGIAAFLEPRGAGLAGLLKPESRIHVLSADFERAMNAAVGAVQARGEVGGAKQVCYSCGASCSAFLAACPGCRSVLIVEPDARSNDAPDKTPSDKTSMKYCPVCDAEYSATHSRCSVCGVELVPEELRGRPLDERQRKERLEIIWRGGDPGVVSEAIEILRAAGIRHNVQATNDHFVFELGMPRPKYAVRVFASDAQRGRELLAGVQDTSPFGSMADSARELAQEPVTENPVRKMPGNQTAATLEIWSGDDGALAQHIQDCLRENRIAVRCEGRSPGRLRLLVPPSEEAGSREILREIREASPPA